MTENQKRITELVELIQSENAGHINMNLPLRPIEATYLFDLMTIFCWLDLEHQDRAVRALNAVLHDQIAESKGIYKAI